MANFIDRVIGFVSPQAGIARHFARRQLQRAYEAASPRDTWRPRRAGASANADHQADAKALRSKARALVQNVPYIWAGLNSLAVATVGAGIVPRATGRDKEKINELLAEWFKVCDADGRFDFFGFVKAAYTAMEQDGEVLVRKRTRSASSGMAVPLQLQLLEIDWLDSARSGTLNGNSIINGIEYDLLGAVAAYYLCCCRARSFAEPARASEPDHSLVQPRPAGAGQGLHAPRASDSTCTRLAVIRRRRNVAQESGNPDVSVGQRRPERR
jgi:capsid protein